jgi:hypothetical protein
VVVTPAFLFSSAAAESACLFLVVMAPFLSSVLVGETSLLRDHQIDHQQGYNLESLGGGTEDECRVEGMRLRETQNVVEVTLDGRLAKCHHEVDFEISVCIVVGNDFVVVVLDFRQARSCLFLELVNSASAHGREI